MTVTSEFRDYEDSLEAEDKTTFFGRLAIVQISDMHVQHSKVKADLEARGLGNCVPRPPADVDVFRRVFSCGQRRRHDTDDPNVTENLLIRQVANTQERIVRRIVKELVNQAGETLSYEEVAQVTYNSNHPETLEGLMLTSNEHALTLLEELDGQYLSTRGCLDGNGIRSVVGRALDACSAVNLRGKSGGVYFVPEDQIHKLDELEEWADSLPGANVHTVPLVDNRKQRDKVRAAVKAEMTTDIEALMAEAATALASQGSVTQRKFQSLSSQYAAVKSKVEKYNKLMEEQVLGATDRLSILGQQMGQLLAKVG